MSRVWKACISDSATLCSLSRTSRVKRQNHNYIKHIFSLIMNVLRWTGLNISRRKKSSLVYFQKRKTYKITCKLEETEFVDHQTTCMYLYSFDTSWLNALFKYHLYMDIKYSSLKEVHARYIGLGTEVYACKEIRDFKPWFFLRSRDTCKESRCDNWDYCL